MIDALPDFRGEVAAITIVEIGPVSAAEVDELEELADEFGPVDHGIATVNDTDELMAADLNRVSEGRAPFAIRPVQEAMTMTAGRKALSDTKHWCTPPNIVDSVKKVFGGEIDLDPCSNEHSLVGAKVNFLLPDHDGLVERWDYKYIYVNPPYGSDPARGTRIAHWFAKIASAVERGSQVIALVPVATNTGHWKNHVYPLATAVCFLYQPRVRFYIEGREDPKGAPMSCAVIYYGDDYERFAEEFCEHGAVIPLEHAVLPGRAVLASTEPQRLPDDHPLVTALAAQKTKTSALQAEVDRRDLPDVPSARRMSGMV